MSARKSIPPAEPGGRLCGNARRVDRGAVRRRRAAYRHMRDLASSAEFWLAGAALWRERLGSPFDAERNLQNAARVALAAERLAREFAAESM